jgi:hypothetical protein
LALYAEGVALALSVLSFFALLSGGGEDWRMIARFCVVSGALGVLLLVLAKAVGVRMIEQQTDRQ